MRDRQASSHIDNFNMRSKPLDQIMFEPKEDQIRKKERTEQVGRKKTFLINGVDYYGQQLVIHRQGQILTDAYSVKGDYFYLKQGQIVNVRYSIGEYVQIKFQSKVGYFPSKVIRMIEGERWQQNKLRRALQV